MNVFCDFHHASLLNSLILLFERRLGGNLYRPIGMEWYDQGYWNVYDHPFTREQFLGIGGGTAKPPPQMYPDGTRPLNVVDKVVDGVYYCQDIDSGYYNKAITLKKFMELNFDYVIASIPQHIAPFKQLCQDHHSHPKMIFQVGNAWSMEAGRADNIMASANIGNSAPNFIVYHQEFDLDIFKPDWEMEPGPNIYSFVNCFGIERFYDNDFQLFTIVEKLLKTCNFKAYGGQCRDGAAHGSVELADKMREARFIWHTKWGGDGYGHIIHNAAAVGRPLIAKIEYYRGKLAEPLLVDGVTCIGIDGLNERGIVDKIEYYTEPTRWGKLCRNMYAAFKKHVDFDAEQKQIEQFLAKLV